MKIYIYIFFIFFIMISCQKKHNLEDISYDSKINFINELKESEKSSSPIFGINSISTKKINSFSYGEINFEEFSIENGFPYSVNEMYLLVNNYNENKYLGINIRLVDDTGNILIEYLIKKYGNPEKRNTGGNGNAFFWENQKSCFFLLQKDEKNEDNIVYKETFFISIKKGTRIENSIDKKVFTVLENINLTYPK